MGDPGVNFYSSCKTQLTRPLAGAPRIAPLDMSTSCLVSCAVTRHPSHIHTHTAGGWGWGVWSSSRQPLTSEGQEEAADVPGAQAPSLRCASTPQSPIPQMLSSRLERAREVCSWMPIQTSHGKGHPSH